MGKDNRLFVNLINSPLSSGAVASVRQPSPSPLGEAENQNSNLAKDLKLKLPLSSGVLYKCDLKRRS